LTTDPATALHNQTQINGLMPQVAASTFNTLSNILAVGLEGDGRMTASWFQPSVGWVSTQPPSFVNESQNITSNKPEVEIKSIAMNENGRLYGVAADGSAITEYSWSSDNPYAFQWVQNIAVL
jgi:hypothetical protein